MSGPLQNFPFLSIHPRCSHRETPAGAWPRHTRPCGGGHTSAGLPSANKGKGTKSASRPTPPTTCGSQHQRTAQPPEVLLELDPSLVDHRKALGQAGVAGGEVDGLHRRPPRDALVVQVAELPESTLDCPFQSRGHVLDPHHVHGVVPLPPSSSSSSSVIIITIIISPPSRLHHHHHHRHKQSSYHHLHACTIIIVIINHHHHHHHHHHIITFTSAPTIRTLSALRSSLVDAESEGSSSVDG
jgi:hypothetical protein